MEEETILEKLLWLKSQGVEIIWESPEESKHSFWLGGVGNTIFNAELTPSYNPFPVKLEKLIIYTNSSIKDVKTEVDSCVAKVNLYLDYLKNSEEVLKLKKEFEKHTTEDK